MSTSVEIVGAGPAGLAAALAVARSGRHAVVSEREADVGTRFHGDSQGLENWTTEGDVVEELSGLGIEPSFDHAAFRECVVCAPEGRDHYAPSGREVSSRAAGWLRSFWYGFLRLFGLDTCPIDEGPWTGSRPGTKGHTRHAPGATRQDGATRATPGGRSGRSGHGASR